MLAHEIKKSGKILLVICGTLSGRGKICAGMQVSKAPNGPRVNVGGIAWGSLYSMPQVDAVAWHHWVLGYINDQPHNKISPRTTISGPKRWVAIKERTSLRSDGADCPKTFF